MVVVDTETAKNILIAIMGLTGTGKTSFVNVASGSSLVVGGGLQSSTSQIQLSSDRNVTLIDTPGFDDTERSDTEILNSIASHLASTCVPYLLFRTVLIDLDRCMYQTGTKLSGILYFHRISDFRMGGISTKNFRMFRELAQERREEREVELASKDFFFKPILAKGARMMRHNNTHQSAKEILQSVMENVPEAMRIQEEIVDERKTISQTAAAAEAERELREQQERHQQEMLRIQREREGTVFFKSLHQAIRAQEEKARQEKEAKEARIRAELVEAQRRREEAERQMREEQARLEQQMREEREAAERRAAAEATERERQAAEVHARILQAQAEAERERWRLQEEMAQLRADDDDDDWECIIA
ncbi:hypothetical protein JOM56_013857 [Amanita muscaria]